MSTPRTIQKWHHDAAKAIFDEHVLPGFHAAHIEIAPEDRVKMIAALAAKIAAHEPPRAITLREDWQEFKPGDVAI